MTWEECSPLVKVVPMAVARMACDSVPVNYFDYENTTSPRMADTIDCRVDKKVVCSPVTSTKCADITYTRCEEVPVTNCSTVSIPVPAQEKLHKQWCLFDQKENIDFNAEVRKITEAELELEAVEAPARDLEILSDLEPSESRPRGSSLDYKTGDGGLLEINNGQNNLDNGNNRVNLDFPITPVFDDLRSLGEYDFGKKRGKRQHQRQRKSVQQQQPAHRRQETVKITRVSKNVSRH